MSAEIIEHEIMWGLHSIVEALANPLRKQHELYVTAEGEAELKLRLKDRPGLLDRIVIRRFDSHQLQIEAEKWCKKLDFQFSRVPSQVFLIVDPLPTIPMDQVYQDLSHPKRMRVVCLDQVTDAHNAGAIARTCVFYKVDYLVIPQKGSFGLSPNFYRISSGAMEHLQLVLVSSLPKFLNRLNRDKNLVIGLSEHAEAELSETEEKSEKNFILVLGAEDKGLSFAVERTLDARLSLKSQGAIKSLNVSVAAALAMDRVFSQGV